MCAFSAEGLATVRSVISSSPRVRLYIATNGNNTRVITGMTDSGFAGYTSVTTSSAYVHLYIATNQYTIIGFFCSYTPVGLADVRVTDSASSMGIAR